MFSGCSRSGCHRRVFCKTRSESYQCNRWKPHTNPSSTVVTRKLRQPENYVNRKGFHSILLQAVCDHEMFIIDAYVGWPGSGHDARVFRRSPLAEHLDNHYEQMCPDHSYLLGDAAYPLKHSFRTPFKDNGNLTQQQRPEHIILNTAAQGCSVRHNCCWVLAPVPAA